MNDISNEFSEAHYGSDGLTLTTPSCGCCSEYYSSKYPYQSWSVSIESLENHISSQREALNRLEKFVQEQKAAGKTVLTYTENDD